MSQTLGEIKAMLAAHGLRPKKRLGQNFLHDHNKLRAILAAAGIEPGDVVLEVGPGTGALTELLLEAGAKVVAVEVDAELEPVLRERLGERLGEGADRLELILGDVLAGKHGLNAQVLAAVERTCAAAEAEHYKLIANLPYNVASPLLINLAAEERRMGEAVVMVQREVADRLAAGPGDGKAYGPLSIIVQAMCEVRRVTTLPPSCFWPQPQVASAVVHLRRRAQPLTDDIHGLQTLTQKLFQKRRKQLGTILGRETALPKGISPDARPEALAVEELVRLAVALRNP